MSYEMEPAEALARRAMLNASLDRMTARNAMADGQASGPASTSRLDHIMAQLRVAVARIGNVADDLGVVAERVHGSQPADVGTIKPGAPGTSIAEYAEMLLAEVERLERSVKAVAS